MPTTAANSNSGGTFGETVDVVDLTPGEDEGTPDLDTSTPGEQPDLPDEKADTTDLRRTDSHTLHLPKVVAPKPLAPVAPKGHATPRGPEDKAGVAPRPKAPKTPPKKKKASLHRKLPPAPEDQRARERETARRHQAATVRVRANGGSKQGGW